MRQKSAGSKTAADKLVKNIRRKTARRYSAEEKINKMWSRTLVIPKDKEPISIFFESDGFYFKSANFMTWSQVPNKDSPTHSVVQSHLKPEGEEWVSYDYRDGKIVSVIKGVDKLELE